MIVFAVFITFQRVISADFTNWDDPHTIIDNSDFSPPTLRSLGRIWIEPRAHLYVPVTYTAWWTIAKISYALTKSGNVVHNPHAFHLVSVAAHTISSLAVFALLRTIWKGKSEILALIAALLFALHPIQVEAVAWTSGLKDVLAGMFSIVAMWQYACYAIASRELRGSESWRRVTMHYILAVIALLLAALSKPIAMMVPFTLIVLDRALLGRRWPDVFRGVLPLIVCMIPIAGVARQVQETRGLTTLVPFYLRPLVALDAIGFYLAKLAWPAHLVFDYGRNPRFVIDTRAWRVMILAPLALAIATFFVHRSRRRKPEIIAGLTIALLGVSPVLGFTPFDFQEYSTPADHYLYLPMLGIAIAIVGVLMLDRTRAIVAVSAIVLGALAVQSFHQTAHWRDSLAMNSHTLRLNPKSWASYNNRAAAQIDAERFDDAMRDVNQSLALRPDNDDALNNLASIYLLTGRLQDAVATLERAIARRPSVEAHANLANAYGQLGRFEDAITQYEAALRLDPRNRKVRTMLIRTRGYVASLRARAATRSATRSPTRPATPIPPNRP